MRGSYIFLLSLIVSISIAHFITTGVRHAADRVITAQEHRLGLDWMIHR